MLDRKICLILVWPALKLNLAPIEAKLKKSWWREILKKPDICSKLLTRESTSVESFILKIIKLKRLSWLKNY